MVKQALVALEQYAQGYDDGKIPPLFTLTLTEEELNYLHLVISQEVAEYGDDVPEILSLFARIDRLKNGGPSPV